MLRSTGDINDFFRPAKATHMPPQRPIFKSQTIPYGEIKVVAETGELLLKSPYMMMGYYKDPENTKAVLKDGWLHSGDKGTIDTAGNVRIVGRVKDAFKTTKGKYIIPIPLEEKIVESDHIEQVCAVGLGIPQSMALVNLSEIGKSCPKEELKEIAGELLTSVNNDLPNYQKLSTIIIQDEI